MKTCKPFILFPRVSKTTGKKTWYCIVRDSSGRRLPAKSTGCSTKTDAMKEVVKRLGTGEAQRRRITLNDYAKDFFRWGDSPWIARQHAKGRPFSEPVAQGRQAHLDAHLLPKFGSTPLSELTAPAVEDYLLSLPLAASTRNNVLFTAKIVTRTAKAEGLIAVDPLAGAESFGVSPRRRDVFGLPELVRLFPPDRDEFYRIWGETPTQNGKPTVKRKTSDPRAAVLMLTLATSGIRTGEARALAWRHVLPGALLVERAVKETGKIGPTKGREQRVVLIPTRTRDELAHWRTLTPFSRAEDLVFYGPARDHPLARHTITDAFNRGLANAGIEREGRNLVVHSFRHLANSMLRRTLPEEILRAMVGHKSEAMSDKYDHLDPEVRLKQLEDHRDLVEGVWEAVGGGDG